MRIYQPKIHDDLIEYFQDLKRHFKNKIKNNAKNKLYILFFIFPHFNAKHQIFVVDDYTQVMQVHLPKS